MIRNALFYYLRLLRENKGSVALLLLLLAFAAAAVTTYLVSSDSLTNPWPTGSGGPCAKWCWKNKYKNQHNKYCRGCSFSKFWEKENNRRREVMKKKNEEEIKQKNLKNPEMDQEIKDQIDKLLAEAEMYKKARDATLAKIRALKQ